MKKYIFLFSMFLSMVLASCTVSKSVISQDTDLTKYKYVTVIDNDTYRMPPGKSSVSCPLKPSDSAPLC